MATFASSSWQMLQSVTPGPGTENRANDCTNFGGPMTAHPARQFFQQSIEDIVWSQKPENNTTEFIPGSKVPFDREDRRRPSVGRVDRFRPLTSVWIDDIDQDPNSDTFRVVPSDCNSIVEDADPERW